MVIFVHKKSPQWTRWEISFSVFSLCSLLEIVGGLQISEDFDNILSWVRFVPSHREFWCQLDCLTKPHIISWPGQTMVSWRSWRPSPPEKALPGEGTKISTDPLEPKRLYAYTGSFQVDRCLAFGLLLWILKSWLLLHVHSHHFVSSALWC